MPQGAPAREQVLDELQYLGTLEHALVVDYLLIHCALGGGLDPDPDAGEIGTQLAQLAGKFQDAAQREMGHLRAVNVALVDAGRAPALDRATHVLVDGDTAVPVASFRPDHFANFPARERAIATAVDRRYARLRSAVDALNPPLDGDLVGNVEFLLASGSEHATNVDDVAATLGGFDPGAHLRATRVEPADDLERALVEISDQYYRALVANVRARFLYNAQVGGLLQRSLDAMQVLSGVDDLVVERGLVPRFSLSAM